MRCYYVLMHGRLDWHDSADGPDVPHTERPAGFYCHRHVLARTPDAAVRKAAASACADFDQQTGWLRGNFADLAITVEETSVASYIKVFVPANRDFTFYEHE